MKILFQVSWDCPGNGVAKECQAKSDVRIRFSDFISDFWKQIGYIPGNDSHCPADEEAEKVDIQIGGVFTPTRPKLVENVTNPNMHGGLIIKWFPKREDHGEIKKFLVESGLDPKHKNITFKDNGMVILESLSHDLCSVITENVSGKKYKGKKNDLLSTSCTCYSFKRI